MKSMEPRKQRNHYKNKKRSRAQYEADQRSTLVGAMRESNSGQGGAGYAYPYPWSAAGAPLQLGVGGLPVHLPQNIIESWQVAPPAPPYIAPPPEYSSATHLTAPIVPSLVASASPLTIPPTAPLAIPQAAPVKGVPPPAAPVKESSPPAPSVKESSPPAAPVKESSPPAPSVKEAPPPAPSVKEAIPPPAPVKQITEYVDSSAVETSSKASERARMKVLLRRIIALEFSGRCSQRSVNVFQTICDALSESPMDIVKVMEVLDESFANAVKACQQQQIMNSWYLVDSIMKLYRDRPEMLNAVVVALPHLLYQYVPWRGSDLAMESWMDREIDTEKYEHLFHIWGRTVPKELFNAIMELWKNGVSTKDDQNSFVGNDK